MVLSEARPLRFREALSKECARRESSRQNQQEESKKTKKTKMFQANHDLATPTAALYEDHAAAAAAASYYDGHGHGFAQRQRQLRSGNPPLNIPNTWGTRGKVQTKQWLAKQRADATAVASSDNVPYAPIRSPIPPPPQQQQDDEDQTVLVNPYSRPTSQMSYASRPASQLSHVSNLSRPVSQLSNNHNNNNNNHHNQYQYQYQYTRPSSRLATPDTFAGEDFESALISKSPPLASAAAPRPVSRRSMVREEDVLDPWMFEHVRRKRHGARWDKNARDVHSPIADHPSFDRRRSVAAASPVPSNASSSRLSSAFDPYEQQQEQLQHNLRVYQLQQEQQLQQQRQQQQQQYQSYDPEKPRFKANSRDLIQKLRRRPTMPESPPPPPQSPRDHMMRMRKSSSHSSASASARLVSYAPPLPMHQLDNHGASPSPAFSADDPHDLATSGLMIQQRGGAPRRATSMRAPMQMQMQMQAWRDESYVEPPVTGELVDETMSVSATSSMGLQHEGYVDDGDVTSSTIQDPLEYTVDVDEEEGEEDMQGQQEEEGGESFVRRFEDGGDDGAVDGKEQQQQQQQDDYNGPRRPPRRQILMNALDTIIEESRESSVGDKTIHSVDGGVDGGRTPTRIHQDESVNGNVGTALKEDSHVDDTRINEKAGNDEAYTRHRDDDRTASGPSMKDAAHASRDGPKPDEGNGYNNTTDTNHDNNDNHCDGVEKQPGSSQSEGDSTTASTNNHDAHGHGAETNMALTSPAPSMPVQTVDRLDTQLQSLSDKVNEIRAGNKSLVYQLSELMSAIAFNKNNNNNSSSSTTTPESSRVYSPFLPLFYMDVSTQEYHPTALGWTLLSIAAWFITEYFISAHFYPRYSLSCDFGICVYPDSPRFPFIIPTLLWRWSGIPFLLTTVWGVVSVLFRALMGVFGKSNEEFSRQHVPSGTRHSSSASPIEPIPAPIAAEFGAI